MEDGELPHLQNIFLGLQRTWKALQGANATGRWRSLTVSCRGRLSLRDKPAAPAERVDVVLGPTGHRSSRAERSAGVKKRGAAGDSASF